MRGEIPAPVRSPVNKPALNHFVRSRDSSMEPSTQGRVYQHREVFMQAIVDKVMRAFTFKHPDSDGDAGRTREEATEFAAELLENYKAQLGSRTLGTRRG